MYMLLWNRFSIIICKKTCVANPKHLVCNRCFIKQSKEGFFCSPLDDGHKTSSRREQRQRPAYDIARGLALQNVNNLLLTDLSNNNVVINSSPEYRRYRVRNNRAIYPMHYGTQLVMDDREQGTYQLRQEIVMIISMARCHVFLVHGF